SVFQQFDLSTAKDDVKIEDSVDLDQEVRTFVDRFLAATRAESEVVDRLTTVRMPRTFWKRLGGVHTYTTDPETFEERDGEVELLSLGSRFVQGAMGILQEESSVGQVRTAEVDVPTTVLYYRYFIETIRSETEAFLTVQVREDGTIESVTEDLAEIPDGEAVDAPTALTPQQWEDLAEKARFEVGTLLLPIMQSKREEAQAEVTFGDMPVVAADRSQLGQVLQNLVANAVKFRGKGTPHVRVEGIREGPAWHFTVADDGIGIDMAHATRLFQIFQRLHPRDRYPGSGLGLAICQRIVERHGGRIWVESRPGQGARFLFTLPASPGPAAAAGPRSRATPA
ncbi:MAG: ATP-binding protein, partial [Thermoplasmatota archaeon]